MSESALRGDFVRAARGDQMAAGVAGAGTQVHDVVGAADRLFIVLDDEHGVAQIAQLFERGEQAAVVARVQADGRLVEHVKDAAQARADLRREANALRFAAGKRGGGAIQAEIAEAHGEQKIEALGDFSRARGPRCRAAAASGLCGFDPRRDARPEMASAVNSAIERPPTFTARLSGRRRRSPQTAHGAGDMYCVSHSR